MPSIGPYELIRSLGAGGMGEVFLARRAGSADTVVLKRLRSAVSPEILQRFEREYEVLSAIDHPNVVPVLEHGRAPGGDPYYTMPHVEGAETLDRWLARRTLEGSPPGRAAVLELFAGLAAGLDHLHARGIFHRDIKPSNILVHESEPGALHARLIDFGLAGLVQSELTRTGTILGTMTYLSPEQALAGTIGAPSDIYQLGLVLYRVLAGFDAVQDPAAYVSHLRQGEVDIPPLRHRGEALEHLVSRTLSRDPARRPPSASGLARALEALPASAWETVAGDGGPAAGRRRAGATVAGLVLLGIALLLARGPRSRLSGHPSVTLGFHHAEITIPVEGPGPVTLDVTSGTGEEKRFEASRPGPGEGRWRARLGPFPPGSPRAYRLVVADRVALEGSLVVPGPPALASLRFVDPARLELVLTAPAGVAVTATGGERVMRVSRELPDTRHELALSGFPAGTLCSIEVEMVSFLGERVRLAPRLAVP